ncbi:MAG: alkylphosphonate utilization protein [Zetaproteobacteria bacterium]|nr:MAG: alkylphosphonate utilization protein [Zetaproteobacteria bacterium]
MSTLPSCPQCGSTYTYEDRGVYVCPECAHEWTDQQDNSTTEAPAVRDAHGTPLADGDTVVVLKDLKIKGSSAVVKVGTKVKNIRLKPESDHNIDCKIPGIGSMSLKSEFVRKA